MAVVIPGYLAVNLLTSALTYVFSSEDATYGRASLYDSRQSKPFRFTGKTSQTILIDFLTATAITCIVLVKHNLTSGVTISVDYGTTSSVADGTVTPTWTTKNIAKTFASVSKRFWRLNISDPGNAAMPEMGELYFGNHVTFSMGFAHGWEPGVVNTNDLHTTEFGSITAYRKSEIETLRLPFITRTATLRDELKTYHQAVDGNYLPHVFFRDITDMSSALYVRKVNDHGARNVPPDYWDSAVEVREEVSGYTLA